MAADAIDRDDADRLDPEAGAQTTDRREVAARLQMAEVDDWQGLLRAHLVDLLHRRDQRVAPAPAQKRSDEARWEAAVERVLRDDMRGALSMLRGQEMAPATEATALEVETLMCLPVTQEERAATEAEARACRELQAMPITTKDVKRRARALHLRRRAGPGASGWRNSYICGLANIQGGPQQLRMWTQAWQQATLPPRVAAMWTAQVAAPQDCGPRKEDPSRRKLRPIALEECLVKFAEGVACDQALAQVLRTLEPTQQGAGSPDGTIVLISLLRNWGMRGAGQNWKACDAGDLKCLFSSDLKNAYGMAYRSALLRGLRLKAPALAAFLGTKWCDGGNTVWQRVRDPRGA